jgi:uncharacterized protein (DUF58 family)
MGQPEDVERFEALVSEAASLAFHLIRNGAGVALISDNWKSSGESSEASLEAILNYLALVQMSAYAPAPPFESQTGALMLSLRYARD